MSDGRTSLPAVNLQRDTSCDRKSAWVVLVSPARFQIVEIYAVLGWEQAYQPWLQRGQLQQPVMLGLLVRLWAYMWVCIRLRARVAHARSRRLPLGELRISHEDTVQVVAVLQLVYTTLCRKKLSGGPITHAQTDARHL